MKRLHLWTPGVAPDSGGIEKYSSFFRRALVEMAGRENVSVFSKNDRTTEDALGTTTGTGIE